MHISLQKRASTVFIALSLCFAQALYAVGKKKDYKVENSKVAVTVSVDRDGFITGDSVFSQSAWSKQYNERSFGVASDAGFKLNIMWSSWSAPGKSSNGQNLLQLTQHDFKVTDTTNNLLENGSRELVLTLKGTTTPLELHLVYRLDKNAFYVRRKLEVRIPQISGITGEPYIRKMSPIYSELRTNGAIIKKGGFGQPVALHPDNNPATGIFWGMEYPTAQNNIKRNGKHLNLKIGDYYGKQVNTDWTASNWVVIGLSPEKYVRRWFMRYVDDIRAQPVRPYLLYNSWYDLEAPQLVDDSDRVMNKKNSLRSIKTLQQRLTDQRGVGLDAFVLDDGWDVYRSNWKISDKQFPHGFKPLVKQLDKTNTDLGVWFGPIGGYSHRDWRINWMKDHGYEIIGNDQLCLAGKNYHKLFEDRVTDFTKNRDIAYFKWDGIQFSCNNPAHGHPVGVYSRRAVMDSLISLDQAVWNENSNAFLNITSGTWLSPWWVKYSSTIWMQGGDYGFTNIPSISHRDRAITYRDFVLYGDFKKKKAWFPISNLMTHGIIKGRLQNLSVEEPLDKFTNNALLYFARGVSMWELYVSPDLLTDQQWDVLAQGIKWAKDRFDIMKHTVMIGGDPGKGEPYGYAHFKGKQGIVIVRNPKINPQKLSVTFDESLGLTENSDSLVVERVYPQKWISPALRSSGSDLTANLEGFETAIYEIFPLTDAKRPLLAGATFEPSKDGTQIKVIDVNEKDGGAHFLNPDIISNVRMNGQEVDPEQFSLAGSPNKSIIRQSKVHYPNDDQSTLELEVNVDPSISEATLAMLLESTSDSKKNPEIMIQVDGKESKVRKEEQQGDWGWYKVPLSAGSHTVDIKLKGNQEVEGWKGTASLWFIGQQQAKPLTLDFKDANYQEPVFPPIVNPKNTINRQKPLGEFRVSVK